MNVTLRHARGVRRATDVVVTLSWDEAVRFLQGFDAQSPLEVELRNALYRVLHG